MKDDKTHNGWANYATWRVNLEMIAGWSDYYMDDEEYERFDSVMDLSDHLKDYAEEQIEDYRAHDGRANLALDYALAFLYDVDWYEIAQHIAEDYPQLLAHNAK